MDTGKYKNIKANNCLFCKKDKPHMVGFYSSDSDKYWFAVCCGNTDCSVHGPRATSPEEAIEKWDGGGM